MGDSVDMFLQLRIGPLRMVAGQRQARAASFRHLAIQQLGNAVDPRRIAQPGQFAQQFGPQTGGRQVGVRERIGVRTGRTVEGMVHDRPVMDGWTGHLL
ncbi:hypothetical protein GCM10007386_11270 [Pseudoduganella dura]|nr:hypothetical protein GCM10007386_11270 [Pseudoduganella dura]